MEKSRPAPRTPPPARIKVKPAPALARKAKPKPLLRRSATEATKAVSVMAWIEDPFGSVLLVKQARGKKLWSFPGGKVKPKESLLGALHRELREELGLSIDVATPLDIYDRAPKAAVAILYRVILKPQQVWRPRRGEIDEFAFRHKPPLDGTPSLRYFWKRAQVSFDPLSFFRKSDASAR